MAQSQKVVHKYLNKPMNQQTITYSSYRKSERLQYKQCYMPSLLCWYVSHQHQIPQFVHAGSRHIMENHMLTLFLTELCMLKTATEQYFAGL